MLAAKVASSFALRGLPWRWRRRRPGRLWRGNSGHLATGTKPAAPLVGGGVGQRANCRSRSASLWVPRLSLIHARSLYASGSWLGNSSMCRSMSSQGVLPIRRRQLGEGYRTVAVRHAVAKVQVYRTGGVLDGLFWEGSE